LHERFDLSKFTAILGVEKKILFFYPNNEIFAWSMSLLNSGGTELHFMENQVRETANNFTIADEGFAVGKTINGKFVILEKRGEGGMGLTYLAQDALNANRKVIIKTIKKKHLDAEGEARFLKEGEALGRINHDGIVRLFEYGQDEDTGLPYLVMEFVVGKNLTNYIKQGQMDVKKSVEIAEQIAFALSAVHREGILHRDLKPDNIMVIESDVENEKVKLIDFGVAKVEDSVVGQTTTLGFFMGTLQYASPEQLNGRQSVAGEVFSLAIIVYQMLTGQLPFQINQVLVGYEAFHELKKLHSAGALNPKHFRPDLPRELVRVLLQGLKENPDKRYQTPLEFAKALRSASQIEDPSGEIRRRKFLWTVAALLAVLAIGLLFYGWSNYPTKPAETVGKTQAATENKVQSGETAFSYSFEVQKVKNNLLDGKPFVTADQTKIAFDDKFQLNVEREKGGSFYIVEQNGETADLIFPNGQPDSQSISGWKVSKPNRVFWLVWSKEKIEVLEKNAAPPAEVLKFLQSNQKNVETKTNLNKMEVKSAGHLAIYKLSL
jgi:serine/threonine protein kinase